VTFQEFLISLGKTTVVIISVILTTAFILFVLGAVGHLLGLCFNQ
jgi:hypothetical protein